MVALTVAAWMPAPNEVETIAALTQVRRARVALLRNPMALENLQAHIKAMPKKPAKVLRRMLNEDLKLMRILDRQDRRRA